MGKFRDACLKVAGVKEWIAEQTGKHFCECGCGTAIVINPEQYYRGIPQCAWGHGGRRTKEEFSKDFWKIVDKTKTCWVWAGCTNQDGYGSLSYLGKIDKAHRVSYKLNIGEIPEDMEVCHHCDNPPCVRPDHLFLGTHEDNMKDRDKKGRAAKKLSEDKVKDIAELVNFGWTHQRVAEKFGVARVSVTKIMNGTVWTHVTGFVPKK